jgi:hypothetical protein
VSRRSGGLPSILVAFVGLALAACSGGDASEPQDSGVEGVVLIGPTCGVESLPPDPACADRPLARGIVRARRDGRLAGETRTDARGRFRLHLAPGRYQLYTSGGIVPFAAAVASARVTSHRFTRLELHVDSGIR